jgi:hypothetical protein
MPYSPVEDIPGIETSKVNIKTLDPLLYSAIESTRLALKHRYNFVLGLKLLLVLWGDDRHGIA